MEGADGGAVFLGGGTIASYRWNCGSCECERCDGHPRGEISLWSGGWSEFDLIFAFHDFDAFEVFVFPHSVSRLPVNPHFRWFRILPTQTTARIPLRMANRNSKAFAAREVWRQAKRRLALAIGSQTASEPNKKDHGDRSPQRVTTSSERRDISRSCELLEEWYFRARVFSVSKF